MECKSVKEIIHFYTSLIAKSKSHSYVPTKAGAAGPLGPQLPPIGSGGFVQLRHVSTNKDRAKLESNANTIAEQEHKSEDSEKIASSLNATTQATLQSGLRRSLTQVMGPDPRKEGTKPTSISDRLAALHRSEDGWKQRISKKDEVDEIRKENFVNDTLTFAQSIADKSLTQSPLIPTNIEGGNVSERLGKLKTSSEKWKNRVEPSDAAKFTVAGRLLEKKISPPPSALTGFERTLDSAPKKCPMISVRSLQQPALGLSKSPSMNTYTSAQNGSNQLVGAILQRSLSVNSEVESNNSSDTDSDTVRPNEKDNKNKANSSAAAAAANADRVFYTPVCDESFGKFFVSKSSDAVQSNAALSATDFDHIQPTERLKCIRRIPGPKGRRTVGNPLRRVALRTEVYHSNAQEQDTKKSDALQKQSRTERSSARKTLSSNFAAEAIAGLASIEDYKAVCLKSAAIPIKQLWLPHKAKMLLLVKGRYHVQTRLVEPHYKSINAGDCFVLLAEGQLYRYAGAQCNVIEAARSKKLCSYIVENHDMGCRASAEVLLDGRNGTREQWQRFWQLLGYEDGVYEAPACGSAEEDELVELSLLESNRIYEFQQDELLPVKRYWGSTPRVELLESGKVLVFDFGSELYVWSGKNAASDAKRAAIRLAQEHYEQSCLDYTHCWLNPLDFASALGSRSTYARENAELRKRAEWCILGKITQNMETALFKEKFADWPECSREDLEKDYVSNGVKRLSPLDGAALFKGQPYEGPNFVLEQASLGRGGSFYDANLMRQCTINTRALTKWQMHESHHEQVPAKAERHFYSGESYVLRWLYNISHTVRTLSGQTSGQTPGRDRCAYFCWQGREAAINEKVAAALLTVELDKEKGAQVCLTQGEENSVFVRLFGTLILHQGRRERCLERRANWRLFYVEGNLPQETLLKEVQCVPAQLRSRASMLLLHGAQGRILLWHGCRSAPHVRELAEQIAQELQQRIDTDLFSCTEVQPIEVLEEGSESSEFKTAFDTATDWQPSRYCSLLPGTGEVEGKDYAYTPRLFNFTSRQGVFRAVELQYALRCEDRHSAYPFTQQQLYGARQPTIFMLDDGDGLWLWMGWWPIDGVELVNDERSSPTSDNRADVNRWTYERRAALETTVSYWRAKFGDKEDVPFHGIKGDVVWAGFEPLAFQVLFPAWTERTDVREINAQDGRTDAVQSISEVLTQLTQTEYPLEVLKQRPLPEGVDPTRLEIYLNDEQFQQALGMPLAEFEQLPIWKQTSMKKKAGLF